MILPSREDAIHQAWILRLLSEILDDAYLSQNLYFKGGTAAQFLGFLDRFSVDLDFDLKNKAKRKKIDKLLRAVFKKIKLEVVKKSRGSLFYVLRYEAEKGTRNSLKLSTVDRELKSNIYHPSYLPVLDRFAICQTKETMFANKLVAVMDRYKKYKTIAGRDIYDVHHFFLRGFGYNQAVISERTGKKPIVYFAKLVDFIRKKITDTIISQDLSYLLPYDKFKKISKVLKKETLLFLSTEIKRLSV